MKYEMKIMDHDIIIYQVNGEHYHTIGKLMDYEPNYKERIKQMELVQKEINQDTYLVKTKDPFDMVLELGKKFEIEEKNNYMIIGKLLKNK